MAVYHAASSAPPVVETLLADWRVHWNKRRWLAVYKHEQFTPRQLQRRGFLTNMAPPYVNLILLLEIAMGVGLLIGALLARLRHFRSHACCQSVIVLLNLFLIVVTMIPSFREHVLPKIPARLGKAYYALATTHAALGTIAEIAGLYILLAAGTSVLPQKFRLTNYKLWMRTVLGLWWAVLLLGLATYARWYLPNLFQR